jgi:uncharacterized membrane protein YedE/YeeE
MLKCHGRPLLLISEQEVDNPHAWPSVLLRADIQSLGQANIFRFLILGIVLGAFIDSVLSGQLTWKGFREQKILKKDLPYNVGGGVLIGFGVLLANGCVVKHLLGGVPGLDAASFVAVIGIIAGMWLGLKIMGE